MAQAPSSTSSSLLGAASTAALARPSVVAAPEDLFVGRERELDAIEWAFANGSRVVTITGTGGIGKTRLAKEYAVQRASKHSSEESWFVDASEARSLEAVLAKIAETLDVPLSDDGGIMDNLGRALSARGDVLLILDNVEQVVEGTASIIGSLRSVALRVRFLVTSRVPLRITGEQRIAIRSLEPSEGEVLFEARAREVDYEFRVAPEERELLREILVRLDGIPLGIELAAARIDTLPLAALRKRLEGGLDILRARRRDVSPRQSTLTATIEWSWNLCLAAERSALMQCGVFRGSFSLEAAEAVIRLEPMPGTPDAPAEILDVLQALLDKCFLRRADKTSPDESARFRLYEPIREFAEDALMQAPERHAVLERHIRYYLAIADLDASREAAYGVCNQHILQRVAAEMDNLFAAFHRCEEHNPAVAARIGLALTNLLYVRGPRERSLRMVHAVVAAAERAAAAHRADRALLCRALILQAANRRLWAWNGNLMPDLEAARDLARDLGVPTLEAAALYYMGMVLLGQRMLVQARSYLDQSLALQEAAGDRFGMSLTLAGLALICDWSGAYAAALEFHERALAASRASGNRRWEAMTLRNRAVMYHNAGDPERALHDSELALAIQQELRDPHVVGTLDNLVEYAVQLGDMDKARRYAEIALARARAGEVSPHMGIPFWSTGWLHLMQKELDEAQAMFSEGIAWVPEHHETPFRVLCILARGITRLLHDRLGPARDDLETALAWCRARRERITDGCIAAGFLAALEAMSDRPERARSLLAEAREEAARWSSARFDRTLDVLAELVAERAPEPEPHGRISTRRRRPTTMPVSAAPALPEPSGEPGGENEVEYPFLEETIAAMLVARARGAAAANPARGNRGTGGNAGVDAGTEPASKAVRVGAKASWIEPPGGERIDLRKRPVLRKIARALIDARRARPGVPVPPAELIASAWPKDRSAKEAIENRLWVAISTLRKLGLGDVLEKEHDGYLLDPSVDLCELSE